MRKANWFVRRASDGRMLCIDGKWRSMVSANRIKFYTSSGRAERYGLKGCAYVDSVAGGSLQSRGSCHAVYDGESVDACGKIFDDQNRWVR